MTVRVGVFGAGGRMGKTVCRAVVADPGLQLVAAVDPLHGGLDLHSVAEVGHDNDLPIGADPSVFLDAGVEVAVDFTVVDAARRNLAFCAANGIHAVVGTTGFSAADYEGFEASFTSSNCLIAPNFAIGAVLMMRFAEMAAPFFETAELIELHHDQKVDAPSGTAMMTLERMSAASNDWHADPTEKELVAGARGGRGPGQIPVHSVRLHGLVAHHEVLFGTEGQSLTVRHDSFDRTSFMPGVCMAVHQIADLHGLTLGLEPVLGL